MFGSLEFAMAHRGTVLTVSVVASMEIIKRNNFKSALYLSRPRQILFMQWGPSKPKGWTSMCYPILYLCNQLFLPTTLHLSLLDLILFFSDDLSNLSRPFGILILLPTCSEFPISCHMQIYCISYYSLIQIIHENI